MGGYHQIPNGCVRSNIFGGDGYLIAYPSGGGLVMMKPSAVDLQYLGLPNTYDAMRTESDREEEDKLAGKMVQLGAQWWPNWDLYFRHSSRMKKGLFYDYHFPFKVNVAFPSTGGLWVANFTQDNLPISRDEGCEPWLPSEPDVWRTKMHYALSMDDKAEVIENMGGTFYSSITEVGGVATTVKEAMELFQPFKERLKEMGNGYKRSFCEKGSGRDDTRWTEL